MARIPITSPVFAAGGKPPGELVEQLRASESAEPIYDNTRHNSGKRENGMNMKGCICLCEIAIYEPMGSRNML